MLIVLAAPAFARQPPPDDAPVVATISNLYYPTEERTVGDTLMRWGTQAMWDSVANELKEFWPDIRKKLKSP